MRNLTRKEKIRWIFISMNSVMLIPITLIFGRMLAIDIDFGAIDYGDFFSAVGYSVIMLLIIGGLIIPLNIITAMEIKNIK